jgi:hypothetical protein
MPILPDLRFVVAIFGEEGCQASQPWVNLSSWAGCRCVLTPTKAAALRAGW